MTLGDTPRTRLALLGGLYFAQGVPWGFVTVALALRLAGLGAPPATIGQIVAAATLPWTLKPLLGPLVDRLTAGGGGRLRGLVLLAEAGMALGLLALAAVDARTALPWFLALALVQSAFGAAQDVASDALALAILPAGERGRANGVMSAGKYAGTLVGGPGLAWLGAGAGWTIATLAAAALLLLPAALVLFAADPPPAPRVRAVLREALRSFGLRATALGGVFAVVAGASDGFLYPLAFPLLRQKLGFSEGDVSRLVALAGIASVAGALFGGVLSDRLGRRRAIVIASTALALAHLGFALAEPHWRAYGVVLAYNLAASAAGGVLYSAALALFMDLTNPAVAATHFQAYMALLNLRGSWAPLAGGHAAGALPAAGMFGLGAALEILPLALLAFVDPARARAAFGPRGSTAP